MDIAGLEQLSKDYQASSSIKLFCLSGNYHWLIRPAMTPTNKANIQHACIYHAQSSNDLTLSNINDNYIALLTDEPGNRYTGFLLDKSFKGETQLSLYQELIRLSQFLFSLLNQRPLLDKRIEITDYDQFLPPMHEEIDQETISLLINRKVESISKNYKVEQLSIEYIRQGRFDKLKEVFNHLKVFNSSALTGNSLLDVTIKSICLITILTRVAINEGVDINKAFSLSDILIRLAMSKTTVDDALVFSESITFKIAELIQETRKRNLPAYLENVIQYIDSHVYETITLGDLCDLCNYSKSYVSRNFKKHVGQSISQYILYSKIEESKLLLTYTHKSSKEIASLLCFTHQSHYIANFKGLNSITPREYRKLHGITDNADLFEVIHASA